jgi:hypothetical protein
MTQDHRAFMGEIMIGRGWRVTSGGGALGRIVPKLPFAGIGTNRKKGALEIVESDDAGLGTERGSGGLGDLVFCGSVIHTRAGAG